MRALLVFESVFGNTEEVARAVAAGLSAHGEVDVVEVGHAPASLAADVGLLVIGGPTHAFGMSRPATRQDAVAQAGPRAVSTGIGIREWLEGVEGVRRDLAAAAFDTHVDKRVPGSASRAAHKRLRRLGARLVAGPESFYVTDTPGPLVAGELERARRWGEQLGTAVAPGTATA